MKLLVDQGCPRSTVARLIERGIDAEHVGNLAMASATDAEILEAAIRSGAVVVTLDTDFHRLLATSGATRPSVIRVRIEGLKGAQLADLVFQVCASLSDELEAGAVVSVTPGRVRVRLLPITT